MRRNEVKFTRKMLMMVCLLLAYNNMSLLLFWLFWQQDICFFKSFVLTLGKKKPIPKNMNVGLHQTEPNQ